jgi:hypothetical protein
MSAVSTNQSRPNFDWGAILEVIDGGNGIAHVCERLAREPEVAPSFRVAQAVLAQLRDEIGFLESATRSNIWDVSVVPQGRVAQFTAAANAALNLKDHPLLGRMVARFALEQCEKVWVQLLQDPSVLTDEAKTDALRHVLDAYYTLCCGVDIAGHCGTVVKSYLLDKASGNTLVSICTSSTIKFLASSCDNLACLLVDEELLSLATPKVAS